MQTRPPRVLREGRRHAAAPSRILESGSTVEGAHPSSPAYTPGRTQSPLRPDVIQPAHSKCLACRARVWREGPAADHLDDLCPGCGGPLEAVAELAELVGLRAPRARPPGDVGRAPDLSARISQQIRETIARNDAERRR